MPDQTMRHLAYLMMLAFLGSCSQQHAEQTQDTPLRTASPAVVDMNTLVGKWQDVQDSGRTIFNEQWEQAADGSFSGLGFVLSGKDTVFIEHLGIVPYNGVPHYAATIQTRNAGAAVLFELIHQQDSLVFSNPRHDFPQRIVYVPNSSGGWDVTVSGIEEGARVKDHYHFKRKPFPEPVTTM